MSGATNRLTQNNEFLVTAAYQRLLEGIKTEPIDYVPLKDNRGYGNAIAFIVTNRVGCQAQIVLTGYSWGYIRFEFDLLE